VPYKCAEDLDALKELNYTELAFEIMKHFITDFSDEDLKECINKAYSFPDKFGDESIVPLVKSGGVYFMELYHGSTLAFKDMALSVLPHLMKTALKSKQIDKKILILTATSGDTGKAAMEGFKDLDGISVLVFYPKNGVSEIQKLQMITQEGRNVRAVAIDGNFDDCQTAVKSIFADAEFNRELNGKGIMLSSANSINIGRLIPQIVYYFYGYLELLNSGIVDKKSRINFCVPTGNFGNILAGYYAKKMGLPIDKLICASNINNVLFDFFTQGKYNANRELMVTKSPSMDIIISSNLERLLCHVTGDCTDKLMESLKTSKEYEFDKSAPEKEGFHAEYATENECVKAISGMFENTGYIMDTHTAVAYHAYESFKRKTKDKNITIITSTASPYKFPGSVMRAINEQYELLDEIDLINEVAFLLVEDVPEQIRDLDKKPITGNDETSTDGIMDYVRNYVEKLNRI
jgi:threonine synthase